MAISFAVLLAFVAGFLVRSFLDDDDDQVEQNYRDGRSHRYD
jgi:hypothetical protein